MSARSSVGMISSSSCGGGGRKARFAGPATGLRSELPAAATSPRRWCRFCEKRAVGSRREPSAVTSCCTGFVPRSVNGSSSGSTAARPLRSNATSSFAGQPQHASRGNPTGAPVGTAVQGSIGGTLPSRATRQERNAERAASAVQDRTGAFGRQPEARTATAWARSSGRFFARHRANCRLRPACPGSAVTSRATPRRRCMSPSGSECSRD